MKKQLLCALSLVFCGLLLGQNKAWTDGTAFTLPAGSWTTGVFQPLKYGYSNTTELAAHPLLMPVIPNFSIKHQWRIDGNSAWSSVHSIYFPAPLLNKLAREGTGGIVSPEFEFPAMVMLYNEGLVTKEVNRWLRWTGKFGVALGAAFGDLDPLSTIDAPVVYQRLSAVYKGWYLRLGDDFEFRISPTLSILLDDDIFIMPKEGERFGFEHKGLLIWNRSPGFRTVVGYKIVYGQYPFGGQWNLIPPRIQLLPVWVPLFDFQWRW